MTHPWPCCSSVTLRRRARLLAALGLRDTSEHRANERRRTHATGRVTAGTHAGAPGRRTLAALALEAAGSSSVTFRYLVFGKQVPSLL